MNRKELVKEIELKAMHDFKDINLDISNIQIDEPETPRYRTFPYKKALTISFASIFIFFLSFVIYSSTLKDVTPLSSETEILGFQTVSSAALLSAFDLETLSNQEDDIWVDQLSSSSFSITDELELITDYMNLAETVLGSSDNYIYNEVESDHDEYTYAFEYKGMDFAGNLIEYIGYFNEETVNDNTPTVQGILINNNKTYEFLSEVINEEGILTYRYKVMINQNNYVEVVNNSSNNSQTFSYKVYKANTLLNTSVVNIYQKQSDLEAEIKITNKNNKEFSLIVNNLSDNNGFKVRYNYNQNVSGEFEVLLVYDQSTQENKFQFVFQNQTYVTNRINKGNQKAVEDDFHSGQSNNQSSDNTSTEHPRRNSNIITTFDSLYI